MGVHSFNLWHPMLNCASRSKSLNMSRTLHVLHPAQATRPVRSPNLLLRDLGPAEWEPEDVVEVGGDVHVEAARQVPRLDDPVVVQAQPRAALEVRHEGGDLRLQVVRHRQPLGRRGPDIYI